MFSEGLHFLKELPSPEGTWELVEVIGEGNYGEVYKAKNVHSGEIAAVKVMEAILDKEEDIKAEMNVFENHSHHPNIVDFFGAFIKKDVLADDQLWIVMEYCSGGSVTDLVKNMKEKGERIQEDLISYILREVLSGLSYLHGAHVMHRDVKGQNVLLTLDARVRLIDFGISAVVERTLGRRRTGIGTPYWMAPEVIACENQLDYDYDSRADVWSLGITAIEVADSTPPLFGENPMRALFKIAKSKPPTLQNPNRWSRRFNNFIAKCLVKDFEQRPTSSDMLSHEFVRFVPKDPKVLRRKLTALIDLYQHGEPKDFFSDSSSSVSGADTVRRDLKLLPTSKVVDDLASLEYMDDSILVSQLWKRYQKRLIYTYVGDILVSINPFQKLDIYNEKYSREYTNVLRGHHPPHIFAIAASAYQSMVREKRDQCCVISGESGAGKTEASNILVQQFMKLGRAETRALEEKILKVNPLMEAFGNARTLINNNSSRFGKYLELHFSADGHIAGAHLSEYLLERSRVVSQQRREKNFHILYYILAGLSARKQLSKYRLKGAYHHRYLEQRGTGKGSAKRNAIFAERFDQIEKIFYLFGFQEKEFEYVCSILAAILNIGDIRIETDFHSYIGEVSVVANRVRLTDVAHLLLLDPNSLEKAFTTTHVMTHGETIVRPNTIEQAMDVRDAMAKALYGRLFSWIVNKINPELNSEKGKRKVWNIGILDIFGFENFRVNSFEQLCINVANEQLQFYFNQHIFAWEQEEYQQEGVDVTHVGYKDNRPLLELLLSRPMGVLALLDEESRFPRATDLSLAAKFHGNFQSSPYYNKPKDGGPTFTILHYAGPVTYETLGFLEKNRDTLKSDVSHLLKTSENPIVQSLFHTPLSRTGGLSPASTVSKAPPSATPLFSRKPPMYIQAGQPPRSRRPHSPHGRTPLSSGGTITTKSSQTVSTYFINSLRELMSKMLTGTPHFVRCIRPNDLKSPDQFQPDKVLMQLRYTGVLETTRIRKEGYSHRILFEDFIQRYKVINYPMTQPVSATPTNCVQILNRAGLKSWAMGHTKVFLKYYHIEKLAQLLASYDLAAITVQKVVRGWLCKKRAAALREERRRTAAIKIQAVVRSFLVQCRYHKILRDREKAAVIVQKVVKGWLSRMRYQRMKERNRAAVKIQAAARAWLSRRRLELRHKMATRIQRVVRGWMARRQLTRMKEEARQRKEESIRAILEREALETAELALRQRREAVLQRDATLYSSDGSISRDHFEKKCDEEAAISHRIESEDKAIKKHSDRQRTAGEPSVSMATAVSLSPRQQRTASPTTHRRQLKRRVIRQGEENHWNPLVMSYYDNMQERQCEENPRTVSHSSLSIPPSLPPPSPSGRGQRSDLQRRRKLYEEVAGRQAGNHTEMLWPSAKKGSHAILSPGQWIKRRPRTKPDSLIQKLLDRFDPPILRNS